MDFPLFFLDPVSVFLSLGDILGKERNEKFIMWRRRGGGKRFFLSSPPPSFSAKLDVETSRTKVVSVLSLYWCVCVCYPTSNGGTQSGSSVGTRARCVHVFFCTFGAPDLHARSAISNENFCHRSSGGSLLRVLSWLGTLFFVFLPSIVLYGCRYSTL